jgi:hypothetical protein
MAKRIKLNTNQWIYKNKIVNEIPVDMKYFVYKITEISTGKIYIGYKGFYTNRKKKLLKSEISTDKRKSKFKIEIKESNWKEYCSSSKILSELVLKNPNNFYKEILMFCKSEKQTKYMEQKYQYLLEVLEKDSFNENIAGKFFRKDLI